MDGGDRPVVATFFAHVALAAGAQVSLDESAAHHVRVRRLEAGAPVRLIDGAGRLGAGVLESVGKKNAVVMLRDVEDVAPLPALHLLVPVADRDRTLWLAEKCAELGVTSWQPVYFARSRSVSPRGEGEAFTVKVRARMIGALEQSGGAWLPEIRAPIELRDAATLASATRVVFDRSGTLLGRGDVVAPTLAMIGPEGGIEDSELQLLRDHGWRVAALAGNTLRFETAGVVGVGLLRAALSS